MGNRLFCVVDKAFDESHSFVDGMLCGALPDAGVCVSVYYSRRRSSKREVRERSGITQYESRFQRSGAGRLMFALGSAFTFMFSENRRKQSVFVRNDFLSLGVFAIIKSVSSRVTNLSFQSSFPHETESSNLIFRKIAYFVLRLALVRCDSVFVVNEGARRRVRKLNARVPVHVIPLCSDFSISQARLYKSPYYNFGYVGTFASARKLDVVFEALSRIIGRTPVKLVLFGGSQDELIGQYPASSKLILHLISEGALQVKGRVSRDQIPTVLRSVDFGLNLIPATPVYRESSSTKLAEYLSQGVPVLSSASIPYHEEIHSFGRVGWLVDFDVDAIEHAFALAAKTSERLYSEMSEECVSVVEENLRYERYIDSMASSL